MESESHPVAPPCIYCGSTTSRQKREHVLPQSFGTFKDNWTFDDVCDDCNQYFGNTLELPLGRDTAEGVLRFRHGVKLPKEAVKLLNRRVVIRVEREGPWQGARVFLAATDSGDQLEPIPFPQVGFRRPIPGEQRLWIEEAALTEESVVSYRGPGAETWVVGPDDEALERLSQRLRELGFSFKFLSRMDQPITDDGTIAIAIETTFDIIVQRAIAKIAFNYAAYTSGADLLRHSSFDPVRHFIRHGDEPMPWQVVQAKWQPILANDTPEMRVTNGHLLVVELKRDTLRSKVSLFNEMTYIVTLCQRFSGIWRHISVGHLFDPQRHEIVELTSVRRSLLPW